MTNKKPDAKRKTIGVPLEGLRRGDVVGYAPAVFCGMGLQKLGESHDSVEKAEEVESIEDNYGDEETPNAIVEIRIVKSRARNYTYLPE